VDNYIIASAHFHLALDADPPAVLVYPVQLTGDTVVHHDIPLRGLQVVVLGSEGTRLEAAHFKAGHEVGTAGERYVTVYSRHPDRMAAFMLYKAYTGYRQWAESLEPWNRTSTTPPLPDKFPNGAKVCGSNEDRVQWLRDNFSGAAATLLAQMYAHDGDGNACPVPTVVMEDGESAQELAVRRQQPARKAKSARA
jgi:hypothetical protein